MRFALGLPLLDRNKEVINNFFNILQKDQDRLNYRSSADFKFHYIKYKIIYKGRHSHLYPAQKELTGKWGCGGFKVSYIREL